MTKNGHEDSGLKSFGKVLLGVAGITTDEGGGDNAEPTSATQAPPPTAAAEVSPSATPHTVQAAAGDPDKTERFYQAFVSEIKKYGDAYFLFLGAMDGLREFVDNEQKLYRAGAKTLQSQNGINIATIATSVKLMLDNLERLRTSELGKNEQTAAREILACETGAQAATQEINDLEKRLAAAREKLAAFQSGLTEKRQQSDLRGTCLNQAAERLSKEISDIGNKITLYCKEA